MHYLIGTCTKKDELMNEDEPKMKIGSTMNPSMPLQHLQDILPKENKARVEDMVRKQAAEFRMLKEELKELASVYQEVCPDSMNEKKNLR
jgi:hypothetical protein